MNFLISKIMSKMKIFQWKKIEYLLNELLHSLDKAITNPDKEDILIYIDAGEYGLALETLVYFLEEEKIIISNDDYILIKKLEKLMGVDIDTNDLLISEK